MIKFILIILLSSCANEEMTPPKTVENSTIKSEVSSMKKININNTQNFEITTKLNGNPDLINEYNQTLNIFCMKEKHSKKFKTEQACLNYVNVVLNTCEYKQSKITKNTINCVKNKLNFK